MNNKTKLTIQSFVGGELMMIGGAIGYTGIPSAVLIIVGCFIIFSPLIIADEPKRGKK